MIRELQKADIDRIAAIWLDSNIKAHAFIPEKYWQSHFEMVKAMFPQAEIYVYESAKTIQGFVGLEEDYIAGIFVADDMRSRGIGKCLLDAIKGRKEKLRLEVYQKNTRAIHFYQREGFAIQREKLDEGTGEKAYEMLWRKK